MSTVCHHTPSSHLSCRCMWVNSSPSIPHHCTATLHSHTHGPACPCCCCPSQGVHTPQTAPLSSCAYCALLLQHTAQPDQLLSSPLPTANLITAHLALPRSPPPHHTLHLTTARQPPPQPLLLPSLPPPHAAPPPEVCSAPAAAPHVAAHTQLAAGAAHLSPSQHSAHHTHHHWCHQQQPSLEAHWRLLSLRLLSLRLTGGY
jgi:hypothetical protein